MLAWALFLIENILLTGLVLSAGHLFLKKRGHRETLQSNSREWLICGLTNGLNTVVTYTGYWLWQRHIIVIHMDVSWRVLTDLLLLFFAMDLLMYLFHWLIHHTTLYDIIHELHHQAIDPRPMDLFILHPLETLSFGALWLTLLVVYPFNVYAILIYLVVNLIFGLTGHLGIEPLPARLHTYPLIKYLGTSTFHHNHHKNRHYNFGFYTSLWDRLFGTYQH